MSTSPLADQLDRQQALDISGSFIVQAPAGSGKTELLTLRFLKLLATCEQPEQVLAITFTKKAANEMSRRIAAALTWAADCDVRGVEPEGELAQQRLAIARLALAQDKKQQWHLLDNPARLRVQTIDSLCFYLANQLPILSQLGGNPQVSEDVTMCFVDAIANTLAQLEMNSPVSDDVAALLAHLDNDVNKAERLLVNLLHKRDQWLSNILDIRHSFDDARSYLQQSLHELVIESLLEAQTGLQPYRAELIPLMNFAAENLQSSSSVDLADFMPAPELPQADFDSMPHWRFLISLLLTNDSHWRRAINKNNGFPTGEKSDKANVALCKAQKERMLAVLQQLANDDDLLATLDYVRILPTTELAPDRWQFLAALTRVLAHLSTELLLSFRKYRVIDYAQTSSAARLALGDEDAPTDLALALDHRIQHVLVDEFQDTSQVQLDILRQITAGWEPDDGRTLFLVGDAMQSCYAFRNANVGIYLQVRAAGLGNINLTPLTLATNFRSQERIVSWVNRIFAEAFPQRANISRGAVPYTASVAMHAARAELHVEVEILSHERDEKDSARALEAARVVNHIQTLQEDYPGESIAVLVRARPHLNEIIPALRTAGIQWQSTDIDRLSSLPIITDLISLTRATLNFSDRLAWVSLLRAPWCGLPVNDLHAIATAAGANSIFSALQKLDAITGLSADARERLSGILPVMQYFAANRFRVSLRSLIENCWRMLGGASIVTEPIELDCVAQYLNLLSEHEVGASIPDIDQFCDTVAAAFVPNRAPQEQDAESLPNIHLLTMHKAKGLEFDHVVLPGLARLPASDDKPLLQWHQRLNQKGESRLFLATLSATGSDEDDLYKILRYEQSYKARLENTRLLYIAVTRARASVQLFATLARNTKGEMRPPEASLLSRIWRELSAEPELFHDNPLVTSTTKPGSATSASSYPAQTPIHRLRQPLQLAETDIQVLREFHAELQMVEEESFSLQEEALLGTLVHRSLEAIGHSGNYQLDEPRLRTMRNAWRLQLRNLHDSQSRLDEALHFVENALTRTLQNPELHWLFAKGLVDDRFEVGLTRQQTGSVRNFQIDRSFIAVDGTRWIIDYKTAIPAAAQDEAQFFNEQALLYAAQLKNYGTLYAELESRPVRCALLFTSLGKLLELP